MEIRLEPEIEKKVLENERLIHYFLQKKEINPSDYDDWFQIGRIGLIKAAMTFDEAKNIKFSTYAGRCINNEINMHFRKVKNDWKNVSLDEPINDSDSENALTISELLYDEITSRFTDTIEYREIIEKALDIILNSFSIREKIIFLFSLGDVKQRIIEEQVGISRSLVSRIVTKSHKILTENLQNGEEMINRPFSVVIEDKWIKITFSTIDIDELCLALEGFAANAEEIESFKVEFANSKVEMYFLVDETSFVSLANILQEMEMNGVIISD